MASNITVTRIALNDHDRLLAREVIDAAHVKYIAGEAADLPECRDLVIAQRWPVRGTGGVAMSQLTTIARVRAAIIEFYEPSDLPERNT